MPLAVSTNAWFTAQTQSTVPVLSHSPVEIILAWFGNTPSFRLKLSLSLSPSLHDGLMVTWDCYPTESWTPTTGTLRATFQNVWQEGGRREGEAEKDTQRQTQTRPTLRQRKRRFRQTAGQSASQPASQPHTHTSRLRLVRVITEKAYCYQQQRQDLQACGTAQNTTRIIIKTLMAEGGAVRSIVS